MTSNTSTAPKIVGIKEFRMNITKLTREAREKHQPIIVMSHMRPIFTVHPFDEDAQMAELLERIKEADADIAAGRVYSAEEVMAYISARP